ncbi:MAG: LPXTG cell wall anchor domain-containing protein, partial [Streptococcus sp.]|nr:LPXTG cell wall anchor domain-containing protein [Streptococcus sp.]
QTAYNKAVTKQVSAKVLKEKPQANYQAKSASLPNTGDDQTAIFSLMGLMVIGLAGGLRKRKG